MASEDFGKIRTQTLPTKKVSDLSGSRNKPLSLLYGQPLKRAFAEAEKRCHQKTPTEAGSSGHGERQKGLGLQAVALELRASVLQVQ